jgi:glc operon protein GlcG
MRLFSERSRLILIYTGLTFSGLIASWASPIAMIADCEARQAPAAVRGEADEREAEIAKDRGRGESARGERDSLLTSKIRDDANMFTKAAIKKAQSILNEMETKRHVPIVIETVESLKGELIGEAALERARKAASQGIYILMSKDDHEISTPLVSRRFASRVKDSSRTEIRDAFVARFREGKFDEGLIDGIAAINLALAPTLEEMAKTEEPYTFRGGREAAGGSRRRGSAATEANRSTHEQLIVRNRIRLTLAGARTILAAAEAKAVELGVRENIAIVDDGGNMLLFERMEGARPASAATATTKAVAAATLMRATGPFPNDQNPDMFLGLGLQNAAAASGAKITTLKGGIPVTVDGQVIGAVGVGGGTGEQDAQVAQAGIDALLSKIQAESTEPAPPSK